MTDQPVSLRKVRLVQQYLGRKVPVAIGMLPPGDYSGVIRVGNKLWLLASHVQLRPPDSDTPEVVDIVVKELTVYDLQFLS